MSNHINTCVCLYVASMFLEKKSSAFEGQYSPWHFAKLRVRNVAK
jgi:hypothetical protein